MTDLYSASTEPRLFDYVEMLGVVVSAAFE